MATWHQASVLVPFFSNSICSPCVSVTLQKLLQYFKLFSVTVDMVTSDLQCYYCKKIINLLKAQMIFQHFLAIKIFKEGIYIVFFRHNATAHLCIVQT